MRYLLDTHALLWALGEPGALAPAARDTIASPTNLIFVSTASLWECAIKASIGKLALPEDFFDAISGTGYEVLQIRIPHLNVYRSLPMHHRDPFDRILVAQAKAEALTLITRDPEIAKYDIGRLVC
jgi:PIN domain nuclease of toxin-antitoxin system